MTSNLLLQIDQLHIDFVGNEGVVHAIQDLNFSVEKGETIGIVGESGSGKSVTSLAIMGLLPPQWKIASGAILFNNKLNQEKQLNSLNLDSIEFPLNKSLEQYFKDQNLPSLNPLQLP